MTQPESTVRSMAKLTAIRQERGLSQAAVARRAGVDRAQVSRLELGKSDPQFSTLLAYTRVIGVRLMAHVVELDAEAGDQR